MENADDKPYGEQYLQSQLEMIRDWPPTNFYMKSTKTVYQRVHNFHTGWHPNRRKHPACQKLTLSSPHMGNGEEGVLHYSLLSLSHRIFPPHLKRRPFFVLPAGCC